jgi:hypothetical protein
MNRILARRRFPIPKDRSTSALALDLFAGAAAAYSVRKLKRSYTGNCLRLRRTNDNAESDFGFTSTGWLDAAAIAAWQSDDALIRVVTWYDQSGNSKDMTMATALNQPSFSFTALASIAGPKFVSASSTRLARAQDLLATGATPCTLFTIARRQAVDATETMLSIGANVAGGRPTLQSNTSERALVSYSGGVVTSAVSSWPVTTTRAVAGRCDNVNNTALLNGVQTSVAAAALNVGSTEAVIGRSAGTTGYWNDAILECIVYANATMDWTNLQSNQMGAFGL